MTKTLLMTLSLSAAMMISASAMAGQPSQPGSVPNQAISWDELQARCLHPEQFNVQKAPQNIVLQCSETSMDYVAASSGDVALPSSRIVTTAVVSDKFHVAASERPYLASAAQGSCLRYKEVERKVSVEHPLSCDEVLSMKGDVSDYCASTLEGAKGSNPKLVETRETGRMMDTCSGLPLVQGQPAQGGKGDMGKGGDNGKGGDQGKSGKLYF